MPPQAPAQRTPPASGGTRVVNVPAAAPASDPRLPPIGTVIARPYEGRGVRVTVTADGFEHDGERYKALTAVAEHVTGSHLNGFRFYRLDNGSKA